MKKTIGFILPWFLKLATLSAQDLFEMQLGVNAGFRQDRAVNFILPDTTLSSSNISEGTFEETFYDMRPPQFGAYAALRFWWIIVKGSGDLAYIESGKVHSTYSATYSPQGSTLIPVEGNFHSNAGGKLWDAFGTLALQIPFFHSGSQGAYLVPLAGWSEHRQILEQQSTQPATINLGSISLPASTSNPTLLTPNYSSPLKRKWWGRFAGGEILIKNDRVETRFGAAYHQLKLKQITKATNTLFFVVSPETATLEITDRNSFRHSTYGERAWFTLTYVSPFHFKVGATGSFFQIHPIKKSSTSQVTVTTSTQGLIRSPSSTFTSHPLVKVKWFTFSALLDLGYEY